MIFMYKKEKRKKKKTLLLNLCFSSSQLKCYLTEKLFLKCDILLLSDCRLVQGNCDVLFILCFLYNKPLI